MGLVPVLSSKAAANMCLGVTPEQTEGPFYPVSAKIEADNDLTQLVGKVDKAKGEVIYVQGQVTDKDCLPISGALVEIWQACETGKYNHPNDPNPAEIDENFQYFGRCITDSQGMYIFKTIRPGQYPASSNWMRPAHIHYKVHLRGYEELTTQMYFQHDNLNDQDLILKSLSVEDQERVVVDFSKKEKDGIPIGDFNITLNRITT